jgi:hypothetical protein
MVRNAMGRLMWPPVDTNILVAGCVGTSSSSPSPNRRPHENDGIPRYLLHLTYGKSSDNKTKQSIKKTGGKGGGRGGTGNNKHVFYLPYNHGILVGSFPTLLRVDTSDATCTIATYSARKRSQECIVLGF